MATVPVYFHQLHSNTYSKHWLRLPQTVMKSKPSANNCLCIKPALSELGWDCGQWVGIDKTNELIQIQQTAWREKQQLMIKSYNSRARNINLSIFPSDAEWTPKKLVTVHDAAGALAERGRDSGYHCPRQSLHPLSPDKPPHQQFSSLKTQHDQWKSQHDQQGAEAEQRLQKYVWVQQRSVHTKHRIPEVIWLHGQALLCKGSPLSDLKRDSDL